MKLLLILIVLLIPFNFFGQTQIGNDIEGETDGDLSGSSVSISNDGNIVAIGAPNGTFGASVMSHGHVRVYENNSGIWTQIGNDIDGEEEGSRSGSSVSISGTGNIVAIGAYLNSGNGSFSGHVRVYENINGTWTQIGNDIDGEIAEDRSGESVTISDNGNILAIGAPRNDGNGIDSGHVRVYENISGTWTQIGNDIDGRTAEDEFGRSISLSNSGNIMAIGASRNSGSSSGYVRVYENISGTWTQIGSDINGEGANDGSGSSVSISGDGNIVAIGAYLNSDNGSFSGHVRIYQNTNGVWTQIGSDIDGEAAGDFSGGSISLSNDGAIVAIGAVRNSDSGFWSGHVRIYQNINDNWTQIGSDIDGEDDTDSSGESVSISNDGSILAIGAPLNDIVGVGSNFGHVRIYDLSPVLSTNEFVSSQFELHPNPASKEFKIKLKGDIRLEKAILYNQLGQFIKEETKSIIDVSKLSKGLYLVEIVTNKGKVTKKVIVE